ncbi:mitochondrial genome maintenance exonuclease 1 isoform X1 [Scomber japonicus]|uniref:mitochondrial genome maintenance exonuclease 1 isoform X1 n=1 Tax=Scomber japonicus TaxID=13676 RepID=UPI002305DB99|nr:mitochondrial genome maintenance exonuclease 1 isoform X1 [Scomber japonicus]
MFILKRVASVGGITMRVPQRTSLPVSYFSACQCLRSSKRRSPYSTVDSERYSSLVKSVMSFRVSSQTPETLLVEDENIYGPIVKSQTPSKRPEMRVPKTLHPFLHCEETPEETTESEESGPPTRILLNRDKDRSFVPSVTRILQQTLSPQQIFYLERWKRKMIAELGEEGFKEYSQNLFRQGKLFHSALEDVLTSGDKNLSSDTPEHPPEVQGYLQSISHVLEDVRAVRAIESAVQHDSLGYRGIVDCVARYRGVLCVIDWKTSEKPKPFLGNTYDNPVQVAAYAGALNNDNNYKYQVESGLIVVAYKDGTPAHAHQLSSELMLQYWNKWLVRFEEFTNKSSSHASSSSSEKT